MLRTIRPSDIDDIVAALAETQRDEYFRDPDRPDGRFVRAKTRRRPIEVVRAQGRLRTARWRSEQDRKRAATLEQIGKSLCVALATSRLSELTDGERSLVGRMLADLHARGFDVVASRETLRRLRSCAVLHFAAFLNFGEARSL